LSCHSTSAQTGVSTTIPSTNAATWNFRRRTSSRCLHAKARSSSSGTVGVGIRCEAVRSFFVSMSAGTVDHLPSIAAIVAPATLAAHREAR
jgi:hypothetical protein